mmetsp:Transcript_12390/g.33676  ORF Transcript_12390/g.33676 Transcript_12390/m.33676 type:complete len:251 (+) Transcript_12390:1511-2263(+)
MASFSVSSTFTQAAGPSSALADAASCSQIGRTRQMTRMLPWTSANFLPNCCRSALSSVNRSDHMVLLSSDSASLALTPSTVASAACARVSATAKELAEASARFSAAAASLCSVSPDSRALWSSLCSSLIMASCFFLSALSDAALSLLLSSWALTVETSFFAAGFAGVRAPLFRRGFQALLEVADRRGRLLRRRCRRRGVASRGVPLLLLGLDLRAQPFVQGLALGTRLLEGRGLVSRSPLEVKQLLRDGG